MTSETPSKKVFPLFRQEAVDYIGTRQYGTVLLTSISSHRWLTAWFVFLTSIIIAFFFLFSTTRKAQCQGVLVPTSGVIRVLPVQAGVIIERRVKEGQSVVAGDVLFVLSNERSNASTGDTNKVISSLVQSRRDSFSADLKQSKAQTRQRLSAMKQRASDMEADIYKLADQITIQEQRVALSEQSFKRYSDLQKTNYFSAVQLQDKQAELLDQRQRLADLGRVKSSSQRELAQAQADIRDLQLQAERDAAAIERNVTSLQQDLTENEARREITVRASQAGTVTAITGEVGQTVTVNSPLASVLPSNSQLEAEIYAPSRSIGFVKPGMKVLLRYQAYPYQKFGQYEAKVAEVANTSLRPEEFSLPGVTLPSGSAPEPLYRIRLTLDKQAVLAYGKTMPLKSGMLVDASILLEQRRLVEWVLEPLYSISGRM